MNRTDWIAPSHTPQFYMQLGELVTRTGDQAFARYMLQLVDALVPISRLELSEWTLDQTRLVHICSGLR